MHLSRTAAAAALAATLPFAYAHPRAGHCAADHCFQSINLPPPISTTVSEFCEFYLHSTPGTITRTSTATATKTVTPGTPTVTVTKTQTPPVPTVTATATNTVKTTILTTTTTTPQTPTSTVTATVTPTAQTVTASVAGSTTTTSIDDIVCTVTNGGGVYTTEIFYASRPAGGASKRDAAPRGYPTGIPPQLTAGCEPSSIPQAISSACKCFLTSHTTTTTITKTVTATANTPTAATATATATAAVPSAKTVTVTVTVTTSGPTSTIVDTAPVPTAATITVTTTGPAPPVVTSTTTLFSTLSATSSTCTATVTIPGAQITCGIPNVSTTTSGIITCTSSGVPGGETNGRLRIEGGSEGTIFEDCVASGPEVITTPSGGSHECDGTNNGANPNPGANGITQIQSAAEINGFTYDGTFSTQFDDFFIERIAETQQTSNDFWGILTDRVFTAAGGCETEIAGGSQELLWAFNAFNVNGFLGISPDFQAVEVGTISVTVSVNSADGNGDPTTPVTNANIETATNNGDGTYTIPVPTVPGCYQYKASASAQINSNAFYLTVLPATSGIGPV